MNASNFKHSFCFLRLLCFASAMNPDFVIIGGRLLFIALVCLIYSTLGVARHEAVLAAVGYCRQVQCDVH